MHVYLQSFVRSSSILTINKYIIMKQHFLPCLLLFLTSVSISSCIGDEPANAECDIEQAWIHVGDAERVKAVFYHAYDTLLTVSSTQTNIVFSTRSDQDAIISTVPLFLETTAGAKVFHVDNNGHEVSFKNGSAIDFSNSQPVNFRVRSEDGHFQRNYTIAVVPKREMPADPEFNFDNNFSLTTVKDGDIYPFYKWTEYGIDWWASGNAGYRLTGLKAQPMDYPTCPELNTGLGGKHCLKLTTRDTGSLGAMVGMRIAAGNLFSGTFDTQEALGNTLAATRMGLPYAHKPSRLTGYYKYVPGVKMQDRTGAEIKNEKDYPDIYCVVYRNTDEQGNPIQLDGSNILSSPEIVGIGRIKSSDIDVSGTQWVHFDLPVAYNATIERADVENYLYNTAIVFSSSIRGAEFIGAPGSTLWIDNVKLECEY